MAKEPSKVGGVVEHGQTRVRSSLVGSLVHSYDCIEVQGNSLVGVLQGMAREIEKLFHTVSDSQVLSVSVNEEMEPYSVTGLVIITDASPPLAGYTAPEV